MKNQQNIYKAFNSMIIIGTLLLSFIIPIQAKTGPADSVFKQSDTDSQQLDKTVENNSVYFEENQGQFDKRAKFFARGTNGFSLFLTATEAVYVLQDSSEFRVQSSELANNKKTLNPEHKTLNSKATALYMKLVGANENSISNGLQEKQHKTNYFKGKKSDWRTDIPNFKQVRMENVYEGIDTVWHGKENGDVQYDFVVQPNVNPNQIEWEIEGAESVEIDDKGSLLIKTDFGTIEQAKPFTYQDTNDFRQEVESSFEMKGVNHIGFSVGNYDTSKTLTIDPTVGGQQSQLEYSTFLGGSSADQINALEIGNNGEVYLVGRTNSNNFPITPGTFDTSVESDEGFITKLNSNGSALVYSTFLGGDQREYISDIAIDANGKVYLTGYTELHITNPFPTTGNAFDNSQNGLTDAFVTVLNENGNGLLYSSFLGSDHGDGGDAIALDINNNIYVTGYTNSGDITVNEFPTTSGAFNETRNGFYDLFVTKLNISLSTLIYSTFIGGQNDDFPSDLAIDPAGNAFVTGYTRSSSLFGSYPTTAGAFDTSHNGQEDVFVTKLNSSASDLIFSTFLGGSDRDYGNAITIDLNGNAYIAGYTDAGGNTFPTTPGAYDVTSNGSNDGFVTKINSTGTNLAFSSLIGAEGVDYAESIALDSSGNVVIGGLTSSNSFPTTANAYDTTIGGPNEGDAYVTIFKPDGSQLLYSTYIGGVNFEIILDLKIDSSGKIHFAGYNSDTNTNSTFPTTAGSFDQTYNGGFDGIYSKLSIPQNSSSIPYDFDGDSKTDVSIFRPSVGQWWYLRSSDGGNRAFQFGASTDIIVPGDYTGDGKADLAFFRSSSSTWFIVRSEDSSFYSFPFGAAGDIPAPGDFDGDGKTDASVFRPSNTTWYISNSSGGTTITGFGVNGDKPVVADYDGDGKDDIAIYRPSNSQWWINQSSAGVRAIQFGQAGDKTVQGDYTGDGKADIAFWRPSNGFWFIVRSEDSSFYSFPFGASTDLPSPGDYDGDGKYDAAVFRPSTTTWFINGSTSGTQIVGFGLNGDKPVPNAYVYE